MKWEYHIARLELSTTGVEPLVRSQETLNELGAEGWELVSILDEGRDDHWCLALLKREK